VSMAGYNTTVEILRSGRPGLLVPRRGPSAEQRMRAELFADRGWVRWLDPDTLDRAAVTTAVGQALAANADPRAVTADLSGGVVAAEALIGLLDEQSDPWPVAGGATSAAAPAGL